MSDSAYAPPQANFEEDEEGGLIGQLPVRPRRRFLNGWSAAAIALLVGAAGFFIGVRLEKTRVSSSGSSGVASALASRFSGARTGSGSAAGFPGRGAIAGGGAVAGSGAFGGGAVGTVTGVSGRTLYLKETDGNTVKVKLSKATTIKKSQTVSRKKIFPDDSVTVQGTTGSHGLLIATSVTDSGAGSTASGSASTSSTSSSGSGGGERAALKSLFGGS